MTTASSLAGERVVVLGLGRFGGGVETVRFLRREGADVVVSDAASEDELASSAREAEALGAKLRFGPQGVDLLDGADRVVANPAIPFDHPVLVAADERGVPVTTEMNLFLERVRAPVLGVTGTKGKSTTATILAGMLRAAGRRVHLGGNVGRALVAHAEGIERDDLVVLELSSFQLWWSRRIARSPHITVVTNLFGDHLDRHGSHEHYAEAKRAALDFQRGEDVAVLPADDRHVREAGYLGAGHGRRVLFGEGGEARLRGRILELADGATIDLTEFPLWGDHNLRNALAAATAALQVPHVERQEVQRGALRAEPLPHRLAPVAEVGGVLYVDDSNATNPTSTRCALEACPRPAVVLVGGKSKGLDTAPLIDSLVRHARAVVGIGTTGPEVIEAIRGHIPAIRGGENLSTAVDRAAGMARPGDAVLLSPAFSSHDQYASFVERGNAFQTAVRERARANAAEEAAH